MGGPRGISRRSARRYGRNRRDSPFGPGWAATLHNHPMKLAAVASLNGMNQSVFVRQAIDSAVLDCTDAAIFGA